MNKKGVVGMFIVFVLFAVLLIFLFGFAVPMLIDFNTGIYHAGNDILNSTNISQFPEHIQNDILSAKEGTENNISILTFFYKYSWLIIIMVLLLVIYLRTRTIVETNTIQ